MRTVSLVSFLLVAAGGCSRATQAVSQYDAHTVARHLETPWALAFAPDGRLFVTDGPSPASTAPPAAMGRP